MCGRYSLALTTDELLEVFEVEPQMAKSVHMPRFNIAPTQNAPVVIAGLEGRRLGTMGWGLVPSWAPDRKKGGRMINARSETLLERPTFRASFLDRRCLVPADGFYEWESVDGRKQPHWIHSSDRSCLALAGIWATWVDANDVRHPTFSILTRDAPPDLQWLHDRVPVIVSPDQWVEWLARDSLPEGLADLIDRAPHPKLDSYPVSADVSRTATEGPDCILPIDPPPLEVPEQRSLF